MTVEKDGNLRCPFAGQERAHRIDQPALRPNELRRYSEQALLGFDEAVEAVGREPPPAFRIAAPGAAARAWRIDQHQVGTCAPIGEVVEFARRTQQARVDLSAGTLGARR